MQISYFLKNSPFLKGIADSDIPKVLECLGAFEYQYEKDSSIVDIGEILNEAGILLSGTANVATNTSSGRRSLLKKLKPSDVFNEAVVCSGLQHSPVRITALEDCRVIKVSMQNIMHPIDCLYRPRIVDNLLHLTAIDYVELNRKIYILSHHSLRERIMIYLSDEMRHAKNCSFQIPFNRSEMADYLQVERSALSRELSRMKKDGLISFYHSHFTILQKSHFEDL